MQKLTCNVLPAHNLKTDPYLDPVYISPPCLESPDYYILSNDLIDTRIDFKCIKHGGVFLGIGSPHVLHILYEVCSRTSLDRVAFIDINLKQLYHLVRLIDWILNSENRIEFLQNVFCGEISKSAQKILYDMPAAPKDRIRGADLNYSEKDLWNFEKLFWQEFQLNEPLFRKTYGRTVEKCSAGLRVHQNVIGCIDTCYLTIACGEKNRYEYWPFTIGFGSGYLRDENAFQKFKNFISGTKISFIGENFLTFVYPFIRTYRYFPIVMWVSNLFDDWFLDKHPMARKTRDDLTRLGAQKEPSFPEYDMYLIQDNRSSWKVPIPLRSNKGYHHRPLSIHSRTFREISFRLKGIKNLEVVNMPHWIEQDGGISKLPCTEYMLLTEESPPVITEDYDTIFLHILAGHNYPVRSFLKKLLYFKNRAKRLVILEHHRWSPDFLFRKGLISPDTIRETIGQENEIVYINGKYPWVRNFLMVYDNESYSEV